MKHDFVSTLSKTHNRKRTGVDGLKRRVMYFGATLLAVLGLSAGLNPGSASASWACSSYRVCTWLDAGGNGSMYYYTGPRDNTCINIGPPFTNAISSVSNTFVDFNAKFWTFACHDGGGFWYTVVPGQQISFTSWPHADEFESLFIYRP